MSQYNYKWSDFKRFANANLKMFRRTEIAESLRTQQVEVPGKNDKNFIKKSNQGKLGINNSFKTNHDFNCSFFSRYLMFLYTILVGQQKIL